MVAFVVGNGAYDQVSMLINPPNDASDIAAALEDLRFEVVKVIDGDHAEMLKGLTRFGRLAAGADVALFFYAGHGVQAGGRNYLIPVSAAMETETDLHTNTIKADDVLDVMDLSGARVKVAILDACRNNFVARSLTRSTSRGLARLDANTAGTIIAFATAPGDVAADGEGRNSPFTQGLLKYLKEPGLEIRSLMGRVREHVYEATGKRQLPWVNEALIGEFYFREGEPLEEQRREEQHEAVPVIAAPDKRIDVIQTQLETILARLSRPESSVGPEPSTVADAHRALGPVDAADAQKTWARLEGERATELGAPPLYASELREHLAALLQRNELPASVHYDERLAKRARSDLLNVPIENRLYSRIKLLARDRSLRPFQLGDIQDKKGPTVFVSSAPAASPPQVDGLFTRQGCFEFFLPQGIGRIDELWDDAWLLETWERKPTADQIKRLEMEIQRLYFEEYRAQWEGLLTGIRIRSAGSAEELAQILAGVSEGDSPLRKLLATVAGETQIIGTGSGQQSRDTGSGAVIADESNAVKRSTTALDRSLAEGMAKSFDPLRGLVSSKRETGGSMERVEQRMRELSGHVNRLSGESRSADEVRETMRLASKLDEEADRLPQPVAAWIKSVAEAARVAARGHEE